jgi:glycosyltransferase involved in cell wall biosynthesis
MPEKVSIILPTRNRPENLRRLYQSIKDTACVLPEIVVYIDNDDMVSVPVAQELGIKYIQGVRRPLPQCYNEAAALATGDVLMFAGDDVIFRTKGWDDLVLSEFAKYDDKILFVYGDDGHYSGNLGTHGFIHRKWMDTVGYLVPPYFEVWYVDTWITDVAVSLNRRVYLPSLFIEHMHVVFGKAENDATYEDAVPKQSKDEERWLETASRRLEDVEKLKRSVGLRQWECTVSEVNQYPSKQTVLI